MGYDPDRRVHRIEFDDDTVFPGLVFRAHGVTVDEYFQGISRASAVRLFRERLIEWNWGAPGADLVPVESNIGDVDMGDLWMLSAVWLAEVTVGRAAAPLAAAPDSESGGATTGDQPPPPDPGFEAGIPTEPMPASASG